MPTSDDSEFIRPRPEVRKFEPYVAGRDLESIKREYRLKKVIKLASNENPLGPSPKAAAALKKAAANVHRYPDSFSATLRAAVARHLGLDVDQVTLGAGSDEIIETLGKAYLAPGDDIVVSQHAFIRYSMAAELMGARTIAAPMKNMTHDLEAMAAAVTPRTKLVFIANPNNPTGTYNTHNELEEFLITLPARVMPVVDEAYFEYARVKKDYPDAVSFLKSGRDVLVLRTFSKAHGLAGLRLGYGAGPKSLIETLERVRPPFNVSVPAQAAGLAALADKNQIRRTIKLNESEKKNMEKSLSTLGVKWTPSAANFYLIRVSPRRGADVCEGLLRRGIIARAMDEYGLPEHVRVTIGLPSENKRFINAFTEVIKS